MTPSLGDTAYGDGQRLVCGAPGDYSGSVEAQFLPDDEAETDAAWIARRIEELVAAGEPVREGSTTRPVRYEDCCILLAARGDFLAYDEALTARGIPVYADARENLLDAPHIRPLIALLKVIDNPAQDIYLAAAMLGPVFGFTDDDLVRLRAQSAALQKEQNAGSAGKPARMSLYGALLLARQGPAEDPFTQKGERFLRQAHGSAADGPQRACRAAAGRNFCHHRLPCRTGGDRERCPPPGGCPAVRLFLRGVRCGRHLGTGARHRRGGAGRFHRTGHHPGGARPGCVTVMTIHRSKGLQFPVVFVADTGRRFNAADTRQPVLLHREYGAGLRLRPEQGEGAYKTAAYTALAEVHGQELRSEQMRLFVCGPDPRTGQAHPHGAAGHRQDREPLCQSGGVSGGGAGSTLHGQANCFADWLRAALLVHPCGGQLRQLAGNLELPFVDTRSTVVITLPETTQPEQEQQPEELEPQAPAAADPALVEQLRAGFGWQYPAADLAAVPAKVSVTSIVHKQEQTTLERPAFLSKDGLTAAEMGTALHAFLEHADFAALAEAKAAGTLDEAIGAERDRQAAAQLTAPEIAAKLDAVRIRRFVQSEAFAKICAAQQVLRELAFITALPAAEVLAAQGSPAPDTAPDSTLILLHRWKVEGTGDQRSDP